MIPFGLSGAFVIALMGTHLFLIGPFPSWTQMTKTVVMLYVVPILVGCVIGQSLTIYLTTSLLTCTKRRGLLLHELSLKSRSRRTAGLWRATRLVRSSRIIAGDNLY